MTESTVTNWELTRTLPALRFIPRILRFLGYNPLPPGQGLGEQLLSARRSPGLSRTAAARILRVDPATLWRWESGKRTPGGTFLERIEGFLRNIGWDPQFQVGGSVLPRLTDSSSPLLACWNDLVSRIRESLIGTEL